MNNSFNFDKTFVVLGNWTKDSIVLELHPTSKSKIQVEPQDNLISYISIGHDPKYSLRSEKCPVWENIIMLLTRLCARELISQYRFNEIVVFYPKTQEIMNITF